MTAGWTPSLVTTMELLTSALSDAYDAIDGLIDASNGDDDADGALLLRMGEALRAAGVRRQSWSANEYGDDDPAICSARGLRGGDHFPDCAALAAETAALPVPDAAPDDSCGNCGMSGGWHGPNCRCQE